MNILILFIFVMFCIGLAIFLGLFSETIEKKKMIELVEELTENNNKEPFLPKKNKIVDTNLSRSLLEPINSSEQRRLDYRHDAVVVNLPKKNSLWGIGVGNSNEKKKQLIDDVKDNKDAIKSKLGSLSTVHVTKDANKDVNKDANKKIVFTKRQLEKHKLYDLKKKRRFRKKIRKPLYEEMWRDKKGRTVYKDKKMKYIVYNADNEIVYDPKLNPGREKLKELLPTYDPRSTVRTLYKNIDNKTAYLDDDGREVLYTIPKNSKGEKYNRNMLRQVIRVGEKPRLYFKKHDTGEPDKSYYKDINGLLVRYNLAGVIKSTEDQGTPQFMMRDDLYRLSFYDGDNSPVYKSRNGKYYKFSNNSRFKKIHVGG